MFNYRPSNNNYMEKIGYSKYPFDDLLYIKCKIVNVSGFSVKQINETVNKISKDRKDKLTIVHLLKLPYPLFEEFELEDEDYYDYDYEELFDNYKEYLVEDDDEDSFSDTVYKSRDYKYIHLIIMDFMTSPSLSIFEKYKYNKNKSFVEKNLLEIIKKFSLKIGDLLNVSFSKAAYKSRDENFLSDIIMDIVNNKEEYDYDEKTNTVTVFLEKEFTDEDYNKLNIEKEIKIVLSKYISALYTTISSLIKAEQISNCIRENNFISTENECILHLEDSTIFYLLNPKKYFYEGGKEVDMKKTVNVAGANAEKFKKEKEEGKKPRTTKAPVSEKTLERAKKKPVKPEEKVEKKFNPKSEVEDVTCEEIKEIPGMEGIQFTRVTEENKDELIREMIESAHPTKENEELVKKANEIEENLMPEEPSTNAEETPVTSYTAGDKDCYAYLSLITLPTGELYSLALLGPNEDEGFYVEFSDCALYSMTDDFIKTYVIDSIRPRPLTNIPPITKKMMISAPKEIAATLLYQWMEETYYKKGINCQIVSDKVYLEFAQFVSLLTLRNAEDRTFPKWLGRTCLDLNQDLANSITNISKDDKNKIPLQIAYDFNREGLFNDMKKEDKIVMEKKNNSYYKADVIRTIHQKLWFLV